MFCFKKRLQQRCFRVNLIKCFAFQWLQETTFHFSKCSFFSDKLGLFYLRLGQYKKLFSFGRKSFFYKIMLNLYISGVGLKSSLSKLNQKSSLVMRNFSFYTYQQSYEKFVLENVLELFKLGARTFHFPRYKKFFQSSFFFFFFSSTKSSFLKYKENMRLESSISGNIRFCFILELELFISWNNNNNKENSGWIFFFYFFKLGLKSAPGSPLHNYSSLHK